MAHWEEIAAQKRESILALIPPEWRIANPPANDEQRDVTGTYIHQFLDSFAIEITETDAVGIVAKISSGQWSAVDVTKAFCHRAALAHQLTNCLLEIFFDDALEQARALDEHFAKTKAPVGPLHGLPVSLKDQFHVKGVETTMGYVGWTGTFQGVKGTGKEKVFESELTKELRASGAVLYCKTSVPHTLMTGETVNHIVGYCLNPKNRNLSAGGSSGGEGALIGLKGSPLGFGSDIGGSVRIPSAFNGLFGLRPSAGRIPYEGAANSMDGQNTVLSVLGPMAGSIESLQLAVKAVLSQNPWLHDPLCLEIPWRADHEKHVADLIASGQSLSFGLASVNGTIQPHPPVRRALDMVCKAVESLGHEVLAWNPTPSHGDLAALMFKAWLFDGGADVHKAFSLSGEPPVSQVLGTFGNKPEAEHNASHIHAINVAKREAQKAYLDYWNSTSSLTKSGRPVDCIISPVAPFAAAAPTKYYGECYANTLFVNALDYTSVVIPITFVDKAIDVADQFFKPLSDMDSKVAADYDPDLYDGTPVSIQLVGRRLQEEKMLALAAYVSKAVRGGLQI